MSKIPRLLARPRMKEDHVGTRRENRRYEEVCLCVCGGPQDPPAEAFRGRRSPESSNLLTSANGSDYS